eukprot:435162_1
MDTLEPAGESDEVEEVADLSNSDVTTKYQEAAKIANFALEGVVKQCVPGSKIIDICVFGDAIIQARCDVIFQKKVRGRVVEKGIAFPTCISVNECLCHNSPIPGSPDQPDLATGDWVKIDLAVHIDGYIAAVAHTIQVGPSSTPEAPLTGTAADVMLACYQAAEIAMATIAPGISSKQVVDAVTRVTNAYGVNLVMGTTMHQMSQFVISGTKAIMLREDPENKLEECEFEANEVYTVDVAVSSGEGRPREGIIAPTVFKRAAENNYQLKIKAARVLLTEVNNRFPALPFALRAFSADEQRQAKLGLKECMTHQLLHAYPVMYERPGDHVAHCKFTILLLPSGTSRVTGLGLDYKTCKSDKELDKMTEDALAEVEAREAKRRSKKLKKKGKQGTTAMET